MKPIHLPFHDLKPKDWQPDQPPNLDGVTNIQLDGEFDGLNWHSGARPCGWAVHADGHSWYLPTRHRAGGNLPEERVLEWAQRQLRNKRISNHSTKIDVHMMRVDGVDLEAQGCTYHDVAHSAALLDDHRLRFNLQELAEDDLKSEKLDPGVPKDQIALAPAWQIAPYAKRDVELVAKLEKVYAPRLAAEGLERVQALEDAVIPTVVEMERSGIPYDQEMLDAWLTRIAAIELDYLWEIRRSFGFDVDPGNKTHLKRVFAALGIEPGVKTRKSSDPEKNGTEYDSFAYEFIAAAEPTRPKLAPLLKCILLRSLRAKTLTPLKRDGINGIYTPVFHQLRSVTGEGETRGVVSGRFSSPLIHQVPGRDKYDRRYGTFGTKNETFWPRELFRETSGYWFCADMKQCQYRNFVHLSQSPRLIQMYAADPLTNFHKMVGAWVRKVRPQTTDTEVKIANFLSLFGGGVSATAQFLKCSTADAQEFRNTYFSAFPEAQETGDRVKAVAESRGYVRSILGRRSRFPYGTWTDKFGRQQRGRLRTHKGLNALCQKFEADALKLKMVQIHQVRRELGYTARLCAHDELDGRLEDPAAAPRILALLNEQPFPMSVPLIWDGGVATDLQSWANAK